MHDEVARKTALDLWHDPSLFSWPGREICREALRTLIRGVALYHIPEEGNILEIGSGTGALDDYLELPRTYVEGSIELATVHRTKLQERGADPAQVRVASLYELPFEDRSVDAVLGMLVLDAMVDIEGAFDEIYRVLRPDGVFIYFHDLRASANAISHLVHREGDIPIPLMFNDGKINHLAILSQKEFRVLEKKIIRQWGKDKGRRLNRDLLCPEAPDAWAGAPKTVQELTGLIVDDPSLRQKISPPLTDVFSHILRQLAENSGMTVLENEIVTATQEVNREDVAGAKLQDDENIIEHGAYGLEIGWSDEVPVGKVATMASVLCFVAKKQSE